MAGAGTSGVNQVERAIRNGGQDPEEVIGKKDDEWAPPGPTGKEEEPEWMKDLDKEE